MGESARHGREQSARHGLEPDAHHERQLAEHRTAPPDEHLGAGDYLAGLAYILTLPVGYLLGYAPGGWTAFFLIVASPIAIALWILHWVIVRQTFHSPRNAFRFSGAQRRMKWAAWAQLLAVLVAVLRIADDGSSAVYLRGLDLSWEALDAILLFAAMPAMGIAAVATLWITVEWIVALVARRRARRAEG